MTRDEIVNQLCNDSEYKKICFKIAGRNLGDEFYSECIVKILEQSHENIERIYAQGENNFKMYSVSIAWNMHRNKYSPFNKLFNERFTELTEIEIENEKQIDFETLTTALNQRIKIINESYKGEFPYDVKMMEVYLKTGSLRKMAKVTGIPYGTCYNSINRFKKQIKDAISLEHFID